MIHNYHTPEKTGQGLSPTTSCRRLLKRYILVNLLFMSLMLSFVTPAHAGRVPQGENSESADCAGKGGRVGKAVVCSGEDWWLPSQVGNSPHGHVISRGFPVDCWQNENVTMIESGGVWQSLQDTDGDGIVESDEALAIASRNDSLEKTLDRYLISADKKYEKKIHITPFDGSEEGLGPDYLADLGVPLLTTYLDEWLATLGDSTDAEEAGDYVATWLSASEDYHGADTNLIYTFWDETFLAEREKFIALYGEFMSGYADDTGHTAADLLQEVNLNSENCFLPAFYMSGLFTPDELDEQVAKLLATADLGSANPPIPADKWLLSVCTGGRAYARYAETARDYGTGIGTHGTSAAFRLPYQILFDNTYYDTTLKAYRPTGRFPYGFIHTDETHMGQTLNTFGEYRMFRNILTAGMALGINRVLVNNYGIVSSGSYIKIAMCGADSGSANWDIVYEDDGATKEGSCFISGDANGVVCDETNNEYYCEEGKDDYFCNFDWDAIKEEGAREFVQWMNKTIGAPAEESPEAYCSLAQMGNDLPEETSAEDFADNIANCLNLEDWGETENDDVCFWNNYYKTPALTYFGRHCDLDQTIKGGQGTPVLLLDKDRLGGATAPDPSESGFGGELVLDEDGNTVDNDGDGSADRTSVFYEGKSTDHPVASESGDTAGNYSLYFKLQDDFVRPGATVPEIPRVSSQTGDWSAYGSVKDSDPNFDTALADAKELRREFVVKVFFENYTGKSGTWRLEYDGAAGWTESPEIEFDEDDTGIQTATFRLNDAMFANRGADGAELAIRSVTGYSAAFLHIRIIKAGRR